jgi:hypothetical protein
MRYCQLFRKLRRAIFGSWRSDQLADIGSANRDESRALASPFERKSLLLALVMLAALVAGAAGCGGSGGSAVSAESECGSPEEPAAQARLGAKAGYPTDETPDQGVDDSSDTVTPVIASVISPGDTTPVLGTDGQYHVAYELFLTNASSGTATLNSVTVLNSADGTPLLTLSCQDMVKTHALRLVDRRPAENAFLPASASRVLLLTVAFEALDDVPAMLGHQFDITSRDPISIDPAPKPIRFQYAAGPVPLTGPEPPVLAPPLEGPGWVASDGCCDPDSHHVNAVLPINGGLIAAERYAIDWIGVDSGGFVVRGDSTQLSNWVSFGAKIDAAAAGTVIAARDGLPDQVPGIVPNLALSDIPGNYVVIDQGGGFFDFYAHM